MIANSPNGTTQTRFDVAILGGGLAGLTLAKQLLMKQPDIKIAIIEKREFPVSEATHKVGESTVEIGAHYFAEVLQLKKHLIDEQLPKFGLRFFFKHSEQAIHEGTEVGGSEFFSSPSYQVDRGRLENFLAKTVEEMGATIVSGCKVKSIDLVQAGSNEAVELHQIQLQRSRHALSEVGALRTAAVGAGDTSDHLAEPVGDPEFDLEARWVVDASGRASLLKRKLQLSEDLQHDINAAWFRIDAPIQIDGWSTDEAWRAMVGKVPRRWLSTNHLMGPGYWVWLIPLASGSTSIGIVADPRLHPLNTINSLEKAFAWLEQHEPQCAEQLEPHREKVQDFLAMRNLSRGTRQVFSTDRWGLVGEAAAFLDPFYSPGSDFIAIGNTMMAKLIEEDLAGNSISTLAPTLQSVYLTLFQNNLLTYRDQYPLFGNARIMALKFVWDYAVYWGFPALLYFNDKLTDISFIQSLRKEIELIREMNLNMQNFFREWHELSPDEGSHRAFVDQSELEVMTRLNAELREALPDAALKTRFENNVRLLQELTVEIMTRVKRLHPEMAQDSQMGVDSADHLAPIFSALEF